MEEKRSTMMTTSIQTLRTRLVLPRTTPVEMEDTLRLCAARCIGRRRGHRQRGTSGDFINLEALPAQSSKMLIKYTIYPFHTGSIRNHKFFHHRPFPVSIDIPRVIRLGELMQTLWKALLSIRNKLLMAGQAESKACSVFPVSVSSLRVSFLI
ncbi:hypothetical protein EJB05_16248, partial [Eragrostis curvula]